MEIFWPEASSENKKEKKKKKKKKEKKKHDQIRVLAESKLNSIADRISASLNNDKMSDEAFRAISSEINKYNQTNADIRGPQKQGLSEDEKREASKASD